MFWKKKEKFLFLYFQELAEEILLAASSLKELFHNSHQPDMLTKKIRDAEHRADTITHEVIRRMSQSYFILPIDREDVLNLTNTLDDVVDDLKECSEAYHDIYALKETTPQGREFTSIIVEGSQHIVDLCKLLHKPSQNAVEIFNHCAAIHQIENRGDELKQEALREIYSNWKQKEEHTTPLFFAWSELYRTLEIITDKEEDCANIAEQIVLKYS